MIQRCDRQDGPQYSKRSDPGLDLVGPPKFNSTTFPHVSLGFPPLQISDKSHHPLLPSPSSCAILEAEVPSSPLLPQSELTASKTQLTFLQLCFRVDAYHLHCLPENFEEYERHPHDRRCPCQRGAGSLVPKGLFDCRGFGSNEQEVGRLTATVFPIAGD